VQPVGGDSLVPGELGELPIPSGPSSVVLVLDGNGWR
jgi:hypothetical protein